MHCRKSVLFHNGEALVKKSSNGAFDTSQTSFDGAEVSEMKGLLIFNKINKIVHVHSHGLFRDDELIIALGNRKAKTIKLEKCFSSYSRT